MLRRRAVGHRHGRGRVPDRAPPRQRPFVRYRRARICWRYTPQVVEAATLRFVVPTVGLLAFR